MLYAPAVPEELKEMEDKELQTAHPHSLKQNSFVRD